MVKLTGTILVAVVAATTYQFYFQIFPNDPCSKDPPIELSLDSGKVHSWNACEVFSTEYSDARHKFRKAARRLHAGASSIAVVVDDGTNDSPLTTDIAILKGDKPGVLVHGSATHGVEGYAGSAIQLALMQEGVLPPPQDRPTIVLVHAINPSGMKNYRRFNEHNVDLNRNAIPNFEQYLKERDPNTANYSDFVHLTAPQRKPNFWIDGIVRFWCSVVPALLIHGYESMKHVLVAGQYHHPQGIFYGGTQWEPSIQGLIDFAQQKDRGILKGNDGPIVWIDIHTGLGKFGMDTVQTEKPIPVESFKKSFPTAYHVLTPDVKDRGALSGYSDSHGALTSYIFEASNRTALTLTQEFGTLPGTLVARAMILENMIYHFGNEDEKRALGRPWLQAAFYPQSTQWRASIVQRGVTLALQSLDFIMSEATQPMQ